MHSKKKNADAILSYISNNKLSIIIISMQKLKNEHYNMKF